MSRSTCMNSRAVGISLLCAYNAHVIGSFCAEKVLCGYAVIRTKHRAFALSESTPPARYFCIVRVTYATTMLHMPLTRRCELVPCVAIRGSSERACAMTNAPSSR
eukprot:6185900-Pleurochrysis_carterae.AAC.2